jgi:hypothetical protein
MKPKAKNKKKESKVQIPEDFWEVEEKIDRTDINVEIVNIYEIKTDMVTCQCKKDGHVWDITLKKFLGSELKCPKCAKTKKKN